MHIRNTPWPESTLQDGIRKFVIFRFNRMITLPIALRDGNIRSIVTFGPLLVTHLVSLSDDTVFLNPSTKLCLVRRRA